MNLSKLKAVTKGNTKTSGANPFMELQLSKVYPNPLQPRKEFNDIEELAEAIQQDGLLQPIVVVVTPKGYMIVSGERRFRAHQHNKATPIKAHVIQADAKKVLELSLIENIQRDDLTDLEISLYIGKLWASGAYESKTQLARALAKSQSYISKAFSSLKLDEHIINDIQRDKADISLSVLDEIARVKDKKKQIEVYFKYRAGEITREEIKHFKAKKPIQKKFKDVDTFTREQFLSYFIAGKSDYLKEGKTYKITIEEV